MNEIQVRQQKKNRAILSEIVVIAILFAIPSILFYIKNKTILNYSGGWTFLMENTLRFDATTRTYIIFNSICFVYGTIFCYAEKSG